MKELCALSHSTVLEGGDPILLVEVKEDDVRSPRNAAQLADYLSMLSAASANSDRQVRFGHVSRFSPISEERAALQKAKKAGKSVGSLRYREIYEALQQDCGPIGYMLREYLEDPDSQSPRNSYFGVFLR